MGTMPKAKSTKRTATKTKESAKPPLGRNLHPSQAERLVVAWETIAKEIGALNETARTAIGKNWPDARTPREAVLSRIPTPEDKIKVQTGNTSGPVEDWLGEFPDEEEEIGPRERAFLDRAGQSKPPSGSKASS